MALDKPAPDRLPIRLMSSGMHIDAIVSVLGASIAPCVLIYCTCQLLLSMSSRVRRTIDRLRHVLASRESATGALRGNLDRQATLLFRRCVVQRTAFAMAIGCIFCVSATILLLFATQLYHLPIQFLVEWLFLSGLLCLLASLALFFADIQLTISTVKLEIKAYEGS